ncbi:MAG: phosphoribosylanthranilate isomerase [Deltaproteobacteria bacterium]|nr:phosphoribosylanthranilate isomerase [Deltaproteobacteria bacterium]
MFDTKIKICGITNMEDAMLACEWGADALGFIFYRKSKRYIAPEIARSVISSLPPFITTVGVFVNHSLEEIIAIKDKTAINMVQLHGDETPEFCSLVPLKVIKAIRVKDNLDVDKVAQYPVQAILFDTYSDAEYGGTGKSFNWEILQNISNLSNIILSGGLSPENVAQAISTVKPYAVDVSSGVEESPGKKDHMKLKKFIEAVKNGN